MFNAFFPIRLHLTQLSPVVGHGLCVVARGGRDDPLPLLLVGQHDEGVPGPALLEAAGVLRVVLLQLDLHLGLLREMGSLQNNVQTH